jgi:hypothetical protein
MICIVETQWDHMFVCLFRICLPAKCKQSKGSIDADFFTILFRPCFHISQVGNLELSIGYNFHLKDAVQSVCKQRLCLHFGI